MQIINPIPVLYCEGIPIEEIFKSTAEKVHMYTKAGFEVNKILIEWTTERDAIGNGCDGYNVQLVIVNWEDSKL